MSTMKVLQRGRFDQLLLTLMLMMSVLFVLATPTPTPPSPSASPATTTTQEIAERLEETDQDPASVSVGNEEEAAFSLEERPQNTLTTQTQIDPYFGTFFFCLLCAVAGTTIGGA